MRRKSPSYALCKNKITTRSMFPSLFKNSHQKYTFHFPLLLNDAAAAIFRKNERSNEQNETGNIPFLPSSCRDDFFSSCYSSDADSFRQEQNLQSISSSSHVSILKKEFPQIERQSNLEEMNSSFRLIRHFILCHVFWVVYFRYLCHIS